MPCSLAERYQHFGENVCLHLRGKQVFFCPEDGDRLEEESLAVIMEATSSKILVSTTVLHHVQENSNLYLKTAFCSFP
jgi:hypothetical protein